jgi:hypothetical protein
MRLTTPTFKSRLAATALACLVLNTASGAAIAGKTEVSDHTYQYKIKVEFRGLVNSTVDYCISRSFPTVKINRPNLIKKIEYMLTQWSLYGDIKFNYQKFEDGNCTEENTNVNLRFIYKPHEPNLSEGGVTGGVATLPWADKPQVVWLDSAAQDNSLFDNILGHELGHTLGLMHEHAHKPPISSKCDDGFLRHLVGVTNFDQNSIMFWERCRPKTSKSRHPNKPSMLDQITVGCMYGFKTKQLRIKHIGACNKVNKDRF